MPLRRFRAFLTLPLLVLACLAGTTTSPASADSYAPVTVISDSVLTSILWYSDNMDTLGQGFELDMHVAVGRRLSGVSIPWNGVPAPTVTDLIPTIPIYPTVIVEMGYNDDPVAFKAEAEQVIDMLLARGAQHIIWPTLAVSSPDFASMNNDLNSLLIAHPQLTLADWNSYSAAHPEWFQTDHLHLMPSGGGGMAALLHGALLSSVSNGTTLSLPQARKGRRFSTLLQAPPNAGPVSWRIAAGSLPRGLQLQSSGVLAGTPQVSGTFNADTLVETTSDLISHVHVTMSVLKPPPAPTPHHKKKRAQ